MRALLIIAGSLINAGVSVAYVRAAWRGRVAPHPFTWGTWSAIALLGLCSTAAAGAGVLALAPLIVISASTVSVFALSLTRRGYQHERPPLRALALVTCGLLGWAVLEDPLAAALAAVCADLTGALPTLRKTFAAPSSEPAGLWAAGALGCACAVAALAHISAATLAYPCYVVAIDAAIALLALRRRPRSELPS